MADRAVPGDRGRAGVAPRPTEGDRVNRAGASGNRPAVVRPTRAELAAASDRLLPDLIAPGLDVLFCGINPGLYSAATGWHFARPGNRFWPALHLGGFTPHRLDPADQADLLNYRLGITNLVARASARADELSRAELVRGGRELVRKVRRHRPRWVAILGVTAYRAAFDRRTARLGPQDEPLGEARLWVLPNPSGLNAHVTVYGLAEQFAALRAAVRATAAASSASGRPSGSQQAPAGQLGRPSGDQTGS